jgi:multidrug efflux system outer membrane protein
LVDRSRHDRSRLHGGADPKHGQGLRGAQQQTATRYLQTIQQAFREVEDALVFHRKVREVRTERERRVAANHRALSLVTLRYERGLSSQLEVLDIQRELFSAELELASATRDQLTAVVQLYRALGGGWQGHPAPSIDGIK